MKHKPLLVVAVLASLTAGGAAFAAAQSDAAKDAPRVHAKLDANGDGAIDRAEAAKVPRLAEKFDSLDKNKDGKLDASERPHRDGMRRRNGGMYDRFAELDTDKDGRISKAEAAKGPMASRFDEMDANKDGYLDKADREQRMKQHRDEWFAKADADKDGKLSRAEFDAAKPAHQMRGGPIDAPPPKP
ncbi:EF-hand domain-containing protein [Pseudoxanthomonas helianthi]|uniref:EF-hand domain-containing protein n=1 Tax=Pseudoxanthomonas helianthi TaxID=1453541 RepID=A0A940X4I7_9GAMM|nr:EF-hand domain-containing protein [Pseudoxanthomonas helianthi]MBP3985913.1 EF-hand domain-containing protein [Pseudoxanthomonas helianthi]